MILFAAIISATTASTAICDDDTMKIKTLIPDGSKISYIAIANDRHCPEKAFHCGGALSQEYLEKTVKSMFELGVTPVIIETTETSSAGWKKLGIFLGRISAGVALGSNAGQGFMIGTRGMGNGIQDETDFGFTILSKNGEATVQCGQTISNCREMMEKLISKASAPPPSQVPVGILRDLRKEARIDFLNEKSITVENQLEVYEKIGMDSIYIIDLKKQISDIKSEMATLEKI